MGEKKREGKVETAIFSGGYLFVMIIDGHDRRSEKVRGIPYGDKNPIYMRIRRPCACEARARDI